MAEALAAMRCWRPEIPQAETCWHPKRIPNRASQEWELLFYPGALSDLLNPGGSLRDRQKT